MPSVTAFPNIRNLVDPLIGTPFTAMNCWDLVSHLFAQGFGLPVAATAAYFNFDEMCEVWYRGDPRDPLPLAQPWDLVVITTHRGHAVSDHVGLVIDSQLFVHSRADHHGVAIARLRTWRAWLLQLARLRRLL